MNTNYARGRAAEYRAINILEKRGCVCLRSAGSHGPADVAAADPQHNRFLIQVKRGNAKATPEEREQLIVFAKAFEAIAQIWSFQKPREPPKVEILYSPTNSGKGGRNSPNELPLTALPTTGF